MHSIALLGIVTALMASPVVDSRVGVAFPYAETSADVMVSVADGEDTSEESSSVAEESQSSPETEGTQESSSEPVPETDPEPVPEEPKVSCKLVSSVYWIKDGENIEDGANKYGDVYMSSDETYVGDTVTAIVSGNPTMDFSGKTASLYKYSIAYVTFNGQKIEASDSGKGEYKFTLTEGTNDFRAYFGGRTEISVMDISTISWKSLFTVDNLLKLIYFALTMLLSSGLFITLIKSKKMKSKTMEEISKATEETVMAVTNKNVNQFLTEDVRPLLAKQSEQLADASDTSRVLMRCMLLSQEDTPEARLAITRELQNYKTSDSKLAEQIQQIIEASIRKSEDDKAAKEQAIQEARDSVQNIDSDGSGVATAGGAEYGTV